MSGSDKKRFRSDDEEEGKLGAQKGYKIVCVIYKIEEDLDNPGKITLETTDTIKRIYASINKDLRQGRRRITLPGFETNFQIKPQEKVKVMAFNK